MPDLERRWREAIKSLFIFGGDEAVIDVDLQQPNGGLFTAHIGKESFSCNGELLVPGTDAELLVVLRQAFEMQVRQRRERVYVGDRLGLHYVQKPLT